MRPVGRHISPGWGAHLSSGMIIVLPESLEDAWAPALPGREAAGRNEALRFFFAALTTCPDKTKCKCRGGGVPPIPTIPKSLIASSLALGDALG